ncbi:uncharacterized protein [Nicotiana tomentosiformis]|uniref:uncharacterized protein n=1 Tax=Nicotiana tomentosiformis TaxID=4098 RepID=UPI00388C629B
MEEIEQVLDMSCNYVHRFGRFEELDRLVTLTPPKPSIEEAPKLELKLFPVYLRYAYLGNSEKLPVIISSSLTNVQEKKLLRVLREHKKAIGWTIPDIKGISPSFYMHKIFLEDGHRPSVEKQMRLKPIMIEVVKKEVIKWLDTATFQRCMMVIFTDMVKSFVEVFMDDFLVFGYSYDDCLNNLSKAKVEAVEKLPPPISVKGVWSFLGHARFYRHFIKDFSKIATFLYKFLEKDVTFNFDEACLDAFEELKKKLVVVPIIAAPEWSLPFELMCDASDHAIGAVLG